MKKKTIIILALLLTAAVTAFFYFRHSAKNVTVHFATVKSQYGYIAKTVTATGNIQPIDTVIVGAQVSGVVKNVYADFNNVVKKGQLLAKVDPSIISAQIEQAKANLANAKSNLEYQQNNFNRQEQLYKIGAISKADYQLAVNQYASAQAAVDNAKAQLKLSERNLYYTNIYSPINGIVLNRNVSAGQTIASSFNAPTLFVIAKDLSKIQVNADVDEADIGGVRPDQNVTFTVDAFPDDVFTGTVQKIYFHPSVSANVVTYPTLINIDNKEMKLKPGMTASITIYVQEDTNALLIPSKALSFKPNSIALKNYFIKRLEKNSDANKTGREKEKLKTYKVWVKNGDTLIEKKILTGLNDDSFVEVIKGSSAGEDVITGVISNSTTTSGSNAQHSPFMPQMPRRPPRNQ